VSSEGADEVERAALDVAPLSVLRLRVDGYSHRDELVEAAGELPSHRGRQLLLPVLARRIAGSVDLDEEGGEPGRPGGLGGDDGDLGQVA
jgi:hypothetical protein